MPKKRRNYSDLLLWSAVSVTVVRYAGAFIASDVGSINGRISNAISIGMGITGLGMGILDVLGTAYIFDGWRRSMPASGKRWPFRFKVLTVFVFTMFAIGIGILVPFTVSRMMQLSMTELLNDWAWLWAVLVVSAPFILIGGIATSQAQAFAMPANEPASTSLQQIDSQQKPARTGYVCEHCQREFITVQALNAHQRIHAGNNKIHEEIKILK